MVCVLKGTLLVIRGSAKIHEDVILHNTGLQAWLGNRAPETPTQQRLTWPGLGGWWVQEGAIQLELPQALVLWKQQCRGP